MVTGIILPWALGIIIPGFQKWLYNNVTFRFTVCLNNVNKPIQKHEKILRHIMPFRKWLYFYTFSHICKPWSPLLLSILSINYVLIFIYICGYHKRRIRFALSAPYFNDPYYFCVRKSYVIRTLPSSYFPATL